MFNSLLKFKISSSFRQGQFSTLSTLQLTALLNYPLNT